jgi:hypothetical protein
MGSNNAAYGYVALGSNDAVSSLVARNNTGIGSQALLNNTTGSNNIALGFMAGANLTTGNNNINIANLGVAGEAGTTRIGTAGKQTATFIAGIRGTATANGNAVPVVIDSAGQLGTVSSSRRFKDDVRPMDNSSEAILGLKPVTFRYKNDTQNIAQFGLIAEEVATINPDLVVRNDNGEMDTARYDAVNAMSLNEFLKEHRKVEELTAIVAKQEATNAKQQKQIEALATAVRNVSDQLKLNKPVPQVAANNH